MNNKFLTNIKVLTASVVLALGVSGSAAAVDIKYATFSDLNGVFTPAGPPDIAQSATDGSGLTSAYVPANNIITPADVTNGYFIETFDLYDISSGSFQPSAGNTLLNVPGKSVGCGINSTGVSITASQPGVANVRIGSDANVAAAPLNDDTCYAYTSTKDTDLNQPTYTDIDYSAFLLTMGPTLFIDYLGFYMGSVDDYNSFEFYNDASSTPVATVTGSEILNDLGGSNGSQTDELSNVWIQFTFSAAEAFDRMRIISTDIAGEFDNITIGLDSRPDKPVPAPTGLALLGLGLLGLGIKKRYTK
jgi:hypothetical protein